MCKIDRKGHIANNLKEFQSIAQLEAWNTRFRNPGTGLALAALRSSFLRGRASRDKDGPQKKRAQQERRDSFSYLLLHQ